MGEHTTRPQQDHDVPARHDPEPAHAEGAHQANVVRARIVSTQQPQTLGGGAGRQQDEDTYLTLEVEERYLARVYRAVMEGRLTNMHGATYSGRNGLLTDLQGNYVTIQFKRSDLTFTAPHEGKDGEKAAVDMTVHLDIH